MIQKKLHRRAVCDAATGVIFMIVSLFLALQYENFGKVLLYVRSWDGVAVWSTGWETPFIMVYGLAFIGALLVKLARKEFMYSIRKTLDKTFKK